MTNIEINDLVKQIDHVPALPQVVSKILEMMRNPNASMFEMGKIISADLAFSAKILKIVNSAFYGLSTKVSSLGKAITMLGFNTLKSAIIGISVIKTFGSNDFDYHAGSLISSKDSTYSLEGLWAHSLGVASSARAIAKKTSPSLSEEVFIGGILHDIGKLIIHQYYNSIHQQLITYISENNVLYSVAEKNILPIPHNEIGYKVAKIWNLPDHLADMVLYHHDPTKCPEQSRRYAEILHVGDIISRTLQIGSGWDNKVPPINEQAFTNIGLNVKDIDKLLKDSLAEYSNSNIFSEV